MSTITERELEKTYIKNLIKPKEGINHIKRILHRTIRKIRRFS